MDRFRIALVAVGLFGCGGKPDCEAYAKHVGAVLGKDLDASRGRSIEFIARDSCKSGDVKKSEVDCAVAAHTADEIRACSGLTPLGGPTSDSTKSEPTAPAKPEMKLVRRSTFSVRMPPDWTASTQTEDNELLVRGEGVDGVMVTRVKGTPKGIASDDDCRAAAKRFEHNTGATYESSAVVSGHRLGPNCRAIHHDAKIRFQTNAFGVGSETLVVNCYFGLDHATPPSFCDDVISSVMAF